jgi:hypothetical protein
VLDVGGGEVCALCLQHALLAERAVDESDVVVQVAPQGLLQGGRRDVDVLVEL